MTLASGAGPRTASHKALVSFKIRRRHQVFKRHYDGAMQGCPGKTTERT